MVRVPRESVVSGGSGGVQRGNYLSDCLHVNKYGSQDFCFADIEETIEIVQWLFTFT